MNRKVLILLFTALFFGAIIAVWKFSKSPPTNEIRLTYLETRITNGPLPLAAILSGVIVTNNTYPVAVFQVVNLSKSVAYLSFDNRERQISNTSHFEFATNGMPVGVLGSCHLEAGTSATVNVLSPSQPGDWKVHATVFKPVSFVRHVSFATRRLWARVSGKKNYKQFWSAGGLTATYKVSSSPVPELPPISLFYSVPPSRAKRVIDLGSPDYDWIGNADN